MFKTVRWRSEKNKIKAVFKLQFHASQVPPLGWEALMVSVVPLQVGKPTAKTEKASVHDGICRWEKPIYEIVKFVKEPKTGKINEKVYQFLVSTGLSKTSFVGEVAVDFANYAEATEASSVSLPLKTSNFGIVLHITIQRIQAAYDGREAEENGVVKGKSDGKTPESQLNCCDVDGSCQALNGVICNSTEGPNLPHENVLHKEKASSATQAHLTLPNTETLSNCAESINILRESICSDAMSALSLDSSSGKENSEEFELKSNNIQQDMTTILSPLSSNSTPPYRTAEPVHAIIEMGEHLRSNTEQSMNSATDGKVSDLTIDPEDTISKERLRGSDIPIEKLKIEMGILARQAEVSELELQALRKQIVKERRRGHDFSKEVRILKEQRDALNRECEQLKSLQLNIDGGKVSNQFQSDIKDHWDVLEEIRKELNHEKNLNADLRLQLLKTQESNSELILAVQNLEGLLEQRNKKASIEPTMNKNSQEVKFGICGLHLLQPESNKEEWDIASNSKHEMDDEEQQALEELVKEHGDTSVEYSLEQRIIGLCSEIEMYKKDHEELEMQMEQLALEYEILKQENHSMSSKLMQNRAEEELEMQYECSGILATINDLEIHAENLEKELQKQADAFEDDLVAITNAKVEQEHRAIRAEETLRKLKWNNLKTAERLQEEFKALSIQFSSTLSANEKLVREASELRLEKSTLQELLEKADQELELVQEFYKSKLKELAKEIDLITKQTDHLLLELKDEFMKLENQKKPNEEKDKAISEEILMLQTQMVTLGIESKNLSEQVEQKEKLRVEMEQMKTSFDELTLLFQRGKMERDELERIIASMIKEAEKSLKALNDMKCLKDEKEKTVGSLQSEVAALQAQHNDLKHYLLEDEDELGKENKTKQAFHLKSGLQNKDDAITMVGKQLKDHGAIITAANGTLKPTSRNNKSSPAPHGSREVANLTEKIKLLEGEIKQKEVALEKLNLSFLRKEKDLCNRIGEVEKAIGEFNQNNQCFCEDKFQMDTRDVKNRTIGSVYYKDRKDMMENLLKSEMGGEDYIPDQNGNCREPFSIMRTNLEKELEVSSGIVNDQCNSANLLHEISLMKERNQSMENELKEVQERYSKISLKFAEVEGERQQLVMTIRNLKHPSKS